MTDANDPVNGNGSNSGISIREYFAAMAMQGLCSHPSYGTEFHKKEAIEWSVQNADQLIEQLNKPGTNE